LLVAPIFAGLATEEESVTTVAGTAGAALRGTQVGNEVVEFTWALGSRGEPNVGFKYRSTLLGLHLTQLHRRARQKMVSLFGGLDLKAFKLGICDTLYLV